MMRVVSFLANHWRASGVRRFLSRRRPGLNIWNDAFEVFGTKGFKKYWETLPEVKKYQHRLVSGREELQHFDASVEYIRENTRAQGLRALWFGCLQGDPEGPEVAMMTSGMFEHIDVMDVARGLLERNEQAARQWGMTNITYLVQDLNEVVLAPDSYDIIYSEGTLHHIDKLERLLDQAAAALRPGGLFIVKDYGGPNRLQFTAKQAAIIDDILAVLPVRYRTTAERAKKKRHSNFKIEDVIRVDPSESIHPEQLRAAILERFQVRKFVDLGGTILHPLLHDIAGNFEGSREADLVLRMLILLEQDLIATGAIPSDYFYCIVERKP